MGDVIAWIEAPKAYNWITLLGSMAGILTAIFTGYMAAQGRNDRRQQIIPEWSNATKSSTYPTQFGLHCELFNRTRGTIMIERVEISGPALDIRQGGTSIIEKHHSWPSNVAPINGNDIGPGRDGIVHLSISVDQASAKELAKSISAKASLLWTKFVWKSFRWRSSHGVKFSICLTVRRKSSPIRPIRFTHSFRIPAATIMQMPDATVPTDKTT